MMRRKPSAKVASAGVTGEQLYVEEELDWLFREQPTEDYGIDAHVEVVGGEEEYDQYEAECSTWDEDDQFFSASFEDWRATRAARGIRPYANSHGEVDPYRLELTLNELGKAFLIVDNFAVDGTRQLVL